MSSSDSLALDALVRMAKELRNFKVLDHIKHKTELLNNFFRNNGLDSCVIGMSGGVDSATTLALLINAQNQEDSPIKKILPIMAPIYGDGITGQEEGLKLAIAQCNKFNIEYVIHDLTSAHKEYILNTPATLESSDQSEKLWARGQMACILRTPCFYYYAAILQTNGFKSLVVGTTDWDEGSYIGFFGKASDAMVDLQPIVDLHKSEVIMVGKELGVIDEITNRKPTGDVWDGALSEDMIGAPFWFLEMYLLLKMYSLEHLSECLTGVGRNLYIEYSSRIEALHKRNSHKYKVGMPSHFLYSKPRIMPGGWQ